MEVEKVEKTSAKSRIRVLIGEISPSMGKRLVEKFLLQKSVHPRFCMRAALRGLSVAPGW
jgi:hypothetical protein